MEVFFVLAQATEGLYMCGSGFPHPMDNAGYGRLEPSCAPLLLAADTESWLATGYFWLCPNVRLALPKINDCGLWLPRIDDCGLWLPKIDDCGL